MVIIILAPWSLPSSIIAGSWKCYIKQEVIYKFKYTIPLKISRLQQHSTMIAMESEKSSTVVDNSMVRGTMVMDVI